MSATQEEGEREEEGESGKKGISEAQAADTSLKTTVKSRKRAADEGFSEVNRKRSVPDTYEGTGSSTASVPVPRNLPDEKTTKEIPLHQLDTFSLLDFIEDFRDSFADKSMPTADKITSFIQFGKIGKYKEIFNDPRMKGEEVLKHYEKRGYREFELPYMALLNGEMEEHEKSLSKIVKWFKNFLKAVEEQENKTDETVKNRK